MSSLPFEDESPFGSVRPANLPPPTKSPGHSIGRHHRSGFLQMAGSSPDNHAVEAEEKAGPNKPVDGLRRVIQELVDEGWTWVTKVETKDISGDGQVVKRDWGGFADVLAMRLGPSGTEVLAFQECTRSVVGSHIQKVSKASNRIKFLCSNSLAKGQYGEASILDNLRSFFASGGRFVIGAWDKDERGRWVLLRTEVTEQTILAAQARQRK